MSRLSPRFFPARRHISNMLKEETLPLPVLELIQPGFSSTEAFQDLGLEYNGKIEVDMLALSQIDSDLATRAQNYWNQSRSFYDALAQNTYNLAAVETKREILAVKQLDTKDLRADLKAQYNDLINLPFFGNLIKTSLKKEVDWNFIKEELTALGGTITQEDVTTVVTFSLPARTTWSDILGGDYSRGEIKREFIITINHAKWRDRKIRRLQALQINAIEIWPSI